MKNEEKRKERATLTMNTWFPGGAIQAIICKIDPLCGAAQPTDVWGVLRPDVDRVSDRSLPMSQTLGVGIGVGSTWVANKDLS